MSKKAIDIVLLPSEKMIEKALQLNKEVIKHGSKKIVLNKNSCFPHISLLMGVIDDKDLDFLQSELESVANKYQVFNLTASKLYTSKIANGENITGLAFENISKLLSLHEDIIKKTSALIKNDVSIEMIYNPSEVEEITLSWIRGFRNHSCQENYFPHITLGIGEFKGNAPLPISFSARTLALCHLGNYCACQEILFSVELSKK